jgi:tellurite resistance protein
MPVPTSVSFDVRLLLRTNGQLLVLAAGASPGALPVLPGGAPIAGESLETAAVRYTRSLLGFGGEDLSFAGSVEHAATPAGPLRRGAPRPGHTLTLLFTANVDDGVRVPASVGASAIGRISLDELVGADPTVLLAPEPIARAAARWAEDGWPAWRGLPAAAADPWWTQLRQSRTTARAQILARRQVLVGADFRDAVVAMCALVASADGYIDVRERDEMARIITTDEVLKAYPTSDLARRFDAHVDAIRSGSEAGRAAAFAEIAKVRGNRVQARAVITFGALIGHADGVFDEDEQRTVRAAIDVLGLDQGVLSVQTPVDRPDTKGLDT